MTSEYPGLNARNLEAVEKALDLQKYQEWLRVGKKDGYAPLPPGMYVQVATVGQIVCECGERFIWLHHAHRHHKEEHTPKPGRLVTIGRRLRWAWRLRSLKPLRAWSLEG